MLCEQRPVISIVGPTASGKSSLAIAVARALDGEVVSADSMQIYRGMDVGTAKVTPDEAIVPHHLIDIREPGEAYSAQQFQEEARACFADIVARGKVPVLCGGTGFYVQAALEAMDFPKGEQVDNPIRDTWQAFADAHGADALWAELEARDVRSASVVHKNNVRRVIRALEMHEQGVCYADQVKNIKSLDAVVASVRYGLDVDRDLLNERIYARVDAMFERGLVDEVRGLLDKGLAEALTAPQAIGYKEVVAALRGECTMEQACEDIKIATRRYAKRQRSWFKRDVSLVWLDATNLTTDQMAARIVEDYRRLIGC